MDQPASRPGLPRPIAALHLLLLLPEKRIARERERESETKYLTTRLPRTTDRSNKTQRRLRRFATFHAAKKHAVFSSRERTKLLGKEKERGRERGGGRERERPSSRVAGFARVGWLQSAYAYNMHSRWSARTPPAGTSARETQQFHTTRSRN